MAFNIDYKEEENLNVFLSGDLDINSVETFKDDILEKYENIDKDVIIDLKDLEYIDSTGIGAIMTVYNDVKKKDRSLTVKNANRNIAKLFKITELDKIFNMEE
ncbi:STAS domain-containing protein [Helcococcus kunzii]|uniref:Anti-sigma factor antagonist n=1 Tax=Helcococcus kunzii ATCC 51366 TaxID=883114 RepID=H3NQT6_9FIRM|nr:STAS domain-containing protein [Helcococcus kunzii]EHR32083.1 anti-anti-sigma factor [Helcococcus kunzii ATCC 51366]MCT1796836.1 STAS domain-containing protein [Helcococcus kunzii]MCT1988394.1 STAS domain-containing protein [Helcococcus kunzii]